jgi:hypothetical protein
MRKVIKGSWVIAAVAGAVSMSATSSVLLADQADQPRRPGVMDQADQPRRPGVVLADQTDQPRRPSIDSTRNA